MIDKSEELAAMAVAIPGLHEAAKRAMEVLAAAGNVAACNGLGWRERALKVEAERDALRSAIMDARAMLVESCLTGSTALVYRIDIALNAPKPIKVVCAWCQAVLTDGAEPASHGICPACEAKFDPAT